jgi:hypothetical protein
MRDLRRVRASAALGPIPYPAHGRLSALSGRALGLREPSGQALEPGARSSVRRSRHAVPRLHEPRDGERPALDGDFVPAFDRDKGPIH